MSIRAEAILLTKQASVPPLDNEKIRCTVTSREEKLGSRVLHLECYLSRTDGEKMRGLMGVDYLNSAEGMLFVYDSPTEHGFWMKNTPAPLTIIWFNDKGEYLDHSDMQPYSTSIHKPVAPYSYALEILTRTAHEMDLGEGTILELPLKHDTEKNHP